MTRLKIQVCVNDSSWSTIRILNCRVSGKWMEGKSKRESSRSCMVRGLHERLSRGMTQNTSSSVTLKTNKIKKGLAPIPSLWIFSSVSKFTLALIRSHISFSDKGIFSYGGWRGLQPRRISREKGNWGRRIDNRGTGIRSFIIGHEWKQERKSTTTELYTRRHWTSATAAPFWI